MRVEFPPNRDIPCGFYEWLMENVGPGNVYRSVSGRYLFNDSPDTEDTDAWFFASDYSVSQPAGEKKNIVHSVTFKDAKMATFFILRWA